MSAFCLLSLLLATAAPGAEKTVWLLEQTDWQREESALLEALLMYTRDLRVPITISMTPTQPDSADAKAPETAEALVQTAQTRCAFGALLVLWFGGEKTAPSLSTYHCAQSAETKMPLAPVDDLDLAAQTLALKLRGVIAQTPDASSQNRSARSPLKPSARDPAAVTDNPAAGTASSPWELGLGYSLLAASADSGLRQGATLRLGRSLARWPIAVEADATFATSMAPDTSGYKMSASDLPMGLGLSMRWDTSPWLLAVGPRVSLHYIKALGSSPDGRRGSDSGFAAGLGAVAQMRYQTWKALGFCMILSSEVVLPRQRFTLDKSYPLDVGMWQTALTVGVVYSHY